MKKKIAVLPGDGIGPEVVGAAVNVLTALTDNLDYAYLEVGYERFKAKGEAINDAILEQLKDFDAILFGAVSSPPGNVKNYKSAILSMRQGLDLYANIRPVKSYIKNNSLDTIIFRENTEGLYSRVSYMRDDQAVAEKIITRHKSERIARLAYESARNWGRKKVTIAQKANVLRLTDGLFLDVCKEVAKGFPEIETNEMYIDNACYQMARNPEVMDVVVTMNLYGDILGDLAAGLSDGLGFVPSAQIGEKWALFESIHGSAPDLAGTQKANPVATILSAKMMLEYLHLYQEAAVLQKAVENVLMEGKVKTFDLGGTATTKDMENAIIDAIK
jgi:isopropylmalate/isohomocitrate dehydrogenase-like protein